MMSFKEKLLQLVFLTEKCLWSDKKISIDISKLQDGYYSYTLNNNTYFLRITPKTKIVNSGRLYNYNDGAFEFEPEFLDYFEGICNKKKYKVHYCALTDYYYDDVYYKNAKEKLIYRVLDIDLLKKISIKYQPFFGKVKPTYKKVNVYDSDNEVIGYDISFGNIKAEATVQEYLHVYEDIQKLKLNNEQEILETLLKELK